MFGRNHGSPLDFFKRIRLFGPSGKSAKTRQEAGAKIFRLRILQIRNTTTPPHPQGGALAIATNRWDGMRWTRRRQAS
jgi:hypothetical protein